jgi:CheY-like chemotaxis protein
LDGIEGLEKLSAQGGSSRGGSAQGGEKIDLVLLDIMMPKMNGYEMLKRVRKDPELKNTRVIILTNLNDSPKEIKKIKDLGIEEYILKSDITLAELAKVVGKYLSSSLS